MPTPENTPPTVHEMVAALRDVTPLPVPKPPKPPAGAPRIHLMRQDRVHRMNWDRVHLMNWGDR